MIQPNTSLNSAGATTMVDLGFTVDGTAALYLIRYQRAEMAVTRLERHHAMTETRISLGRPSVIVVASPSQSGGPNLDTVRAFLVPPDHGVLLARDTWHGLQAFPVGADSVDFAFLSERESEDDSSSTIMAPRSVPR